MPPDRVILFIIGTVVILFGAYYVTYYVGMKASGRTRAGLRNRNIVVHDRYSISRDKCFCVVEIAGKVYIVGVATNAMTLLDTIDAEEFMRLTESSGQETQIPWANTPVGRYGNKLTKKVALFIATKMGKAPPRDEADEDEQSAPMPTKAEKLDFADALRESEASFLAQEENGEETRLAQADSTEEDTSEDG